MNLPKNIDSNLLDENLDKIAYTLDRGYMQMLSSAYDVVPFSGTVDYETNIRVLKIKEFVFNKNERIIDCTKNIFGTFANTPNTLAVVVRRTCKETSFFFVVKNAGLGVNEESRDNQDLLQSSFLGNFPGSKCDVQNASGEKAEKQMAFLNNPPNDKVDDYNVRSIAVLSAIPSDKSEKYVSQGIEKILNGFVPTSKQEEYSIVVIAEALQQDEIRNIISGFEELATSITSFTTYQFQENSNESESEGTNESLTRSVSKSISKTHSVNVGVHAGYGPVGASVGYGYSQADSKTGSTSKTSGKNRTLTKGKGESTTLTYKSYHISGLIQKLEMMIKRLNIAQSTGVWRSATYVLANDKSVATNIAQGINGLIKGDESYVESSAIQIWNYCSDENGFNEILNYINHYSHPVFVNRNDKRNNKDLVYVSPTSFVSTSEIAKIVSFPKHSLPGIPVIECAEFGRTVSSYDVVKKSGSIQLGNVYNMHCEEKMPVELDENNFSSHTFITGSTGSGKSNTIYHILNSLKKSGKHFLVVEPAKGEYKFVFGQNENNESSCDIHVYGTNPDLSSLLRLNPFSFPHGNVDVSKNIHILEHLDRLVEIFNVCWPMYAAMPAVLKESIEKSYEECGWNLTESTNEYGENYYPTFADVVRNIRNIIDSSEYNSENKGAYKGSLITRLKSLTNGINGLIFTTDEIGAKDLFDENVIVDLSRVGSAETKSLIMGLLVLKLQEYRMTNSCMNAPLRHVTILEEAHNLLKRTSPDQSQDSGNLLGKSVEMLANSIAEMRTYGEGFIIADQAPALLDMAVIRNTNTKIIMRLPDQGDRELVGRAANLNDEQIAEIAKLPCGVAAVYQNEWIEPVLCKICHHEYAVSSYQKKANKTEIFENCAQERLKIAELLCSSVAAANELTFDDLKKMLDKLCLNASTKVFILKTKQNPASEPRYTQIAPVIVELFPNLRRSFIASYSRTSDTIQWSLDVDNAIREQLKHDIDEELRRSIRQCVITDYLYNELRKVDLLEQWAKTGGVK